MKTTLILAATLIFAARSTADDQSTLTLTGKNAEGYWQSFEHMHEHFTQSFEQARSFGIRRIVHFHDPEYRRLYVDDVPLQAAKLNLIGLLGNKPVVYESSWLGISRDQLHTYPKRALTTTESEAVKKLKAGKSYVWRPATETKSGVGQLIAPLKAGASCLRCHEVHKGTLLGAFSYEMRPVTPAPVARPLTMQKVRRTTDRGKHRFRSAGLDENSAQQQIGR